MITASKNHWRFKHQSFPFAKSISVGFSTGLEGIDVAWIHFKDESIVIKDQAPTTDVSFSAGVNDLILVAGRKEDADTLFFQRRLSIEGDTELGLEVKNLLDNIEFENLPPFAEKMINHFSSFVKAGLATNSVNSDSNSSINSTSDNEENSKIGCSI